MIFEHFSIAFVSEIDEIVICFSVKFEKMNPHLRSAGFIRIYCPAFYEVISIVVNSESSWLLLPFGQCN